MCKHNCNMYLGTTDGPETDTQQHIVTDMYIHTHLSPSHTIRCLPLSAVTLLHFDLFIYVFVLNQSLFSSLSPSHLSLTLTFDFYYLICFIASSCFVSLILLANKHICHFLCVHFWHAPVGVSGTRIVCLPMVQCSSWQWPPHVCVSLPVPYTASIECRHQKVCHFGLNGPASAPARMDLTEMPV